MWMIDAMIEMSVKVLDSKLLFPKTLTICCAMLHQIVSQYLSFLSINHFHNYTL